MARPRIKHNPKPLFTTSICPGWFDGKVQVKTNHTKGDTAKYKLEKLFAL